MRNWVNDILKDSTKRHYARVVAFAALGFSIGALSMLLMYPRIADFVGTVTVPAQNEDVEVATTTDVVSLSRSLPTSIRIPKVFLETTFERSLGLNADQTVEVPDSYDKVGWYRLGAAPGEVGTAVILGHVDSYKGPAVFYSLGQLKSGDQIFIAREDGTEAVFEVEYSERYDQEGFPSEQVYGKTEYPSLRLITCTGTYDRGVQRYSHNLVVYARLVQTKYDETTGG